MTADVSLKTLLDITVDEMNVPEFILSDPIQVPRSFHLQEDIEISAFLTASIAWGQRSTIIRNARRLMQLMDQAPYDFIMNFKKKDLRVFSHFYHRTFQPADCQFFMESLQNIYRNHGGLKRIFEDEYRKNDDITDSIRIFRQLFLEMSHQPRTEKHVSDITKNSACKRLNLFLMWMVRNDSKGVHFGLWDAVSPAHLYIPLDVHVAKVSRELGLLKRNLNDWNAVAELTSVLRAFDPLDPVKYDFALFGAGVRS
ncbi:MAG: TIGR02757 family protein [Bacteroidia bacterium]|nr:TIGR02757 family protein [Bacteroidia bacterium]